MATMPQSHGDAVRESRWRRALTISAVLALGISAASVWWVAADENPSHAEGSDSYVIRMSDYEFSPEDLEWRVGQRVTLILVNDTQAHPGRRHEFMMGREPSQVETPFGTTFTGGFDEDFFAGVSVELSHSNAVSMVMPSESELTGPDAGESFVMEDMAMDGMDMSEGDDMDMSDEDMTGDDEHADEDMDMDDGADEHADEEMDMSDEEMTEGDEHAEGDADMGHGADHGFMVELEPAGTTTISFVVPDKPGVWEYGCFSESGQHYENGMRGTVTITT